MQDASKPTITYDEDNETLTITWDEPKDIDTYDEWYLTVPLTNGYTADGFLLTHGSAQNRRLIEIEIDVQDCVEADVQDLQAVEWHLVPLGQEDRSLPPYLSIHEFRGGFQLVMTLSGEHCLLVPLDEQLANLFPERRLCFWPSTRWERGPQSLHALFPITRHIPFFTYEQYMRYLSLGEHDFDDHDGPALYAWYLRDLRTQLLYLFHNKQKPEIHQTNFELLQTLVEASRIPNSLLTWQNESSQLPAMPEFFIETRRIAGEALTMPAYVSIRAYGHLGNLSPVADMIAAVAHLGDEPLAYAFAYINPLAQPSFGRVADGLIEALRAELPIGHWVASEEPIAGFELDDDGQLAVTPEDESFIDEIHESDEFTTTPDDESIDEPNDDVG